jgi:hypothetical protein
VPCKISSAHTSARAAETGFAMLSTLRFEIIRVLRGFAVSVVGQEDLDRPVRWLRASKDVVVGNPITVRDAFFCRSV